MNTHKRIDRIKTEQRKKLEKTPASKLRKRLTILVIPVLGIAALFILSLTGMVKFQYFLFFQRIIHIIGPMICVLGMFFMLQARFNSRKPKNYFVRIFIWLIFFSLFMFVMLLVIPDSILFQIQEYFIHFS
ncbi:MAG: hypothetical protein K8S87_12905 [Planctomycetes bacterium]|nr:hypothetical protein [Planctomycetota bacterium]